MQTFDPNSTRPAYMKALDLTNSIRARSVSGKLAMLPDVTATVAPLTGADDLELKTMKTDVRTFNKFVNELLYKHASFDGISFIDFEDFLNKLTLPDRQILLTLLMDATYTSLPEFDSICPKCQEINSVKTKVSTIMNYKGTQIPVWDQPEPVYEKIFEKKLDLDLPGTIKVGIKFATESVRDRIFALMSMDNAKKNLLNSGSIIDSTDMLLMFTEYIEIEGPKEGNKKPEVIRLTNKELDIQGFLTNAPLMIHDAIKEFISETFDKYYPTFKVPVVCSKCGNNYDWVVDIENEFFRKTVPFY